MFPLMLDLKKNIFHPGRTSFRAVAVCLGLLCILLLAGIIGLGIFTLQNYNTNWTERRKEILDELSECKLRSVCV